MGAVVAWFRCVHIPFSIPVFLSLSRKGCAAHDHCSAGSFATLLHRCCFAMSFHHLFLLPVELVRSAVIPKLRLRDLSRLDDAATSKLARVEFLTWIRGLSQLCRLIPSTKPSFLKWIVARAMKIDTLQVEDETDASLVQQLDGRELVVGVFVYSHSNHQLGTSVVDFMLTLKSLNGIQMHAMDGYSDISTWDKLLGKFPYLQSLYLEGSSLVALSFVPQLIETAANHCHLLTSLSMYFCRGVDDRSVVLLAQQCTLLRSLTLNDCDALHDASLQALGQHCPLLSSLQLTTSQGFISDVGLVTLLQGCTRLKSIGLWNCSPITVHSMVALAPISAELEYLALPGCSVFGEAAAIAVKSLRKLRILNLAGCTGISEALLITIIANNPRVIGITLDGGSTVTNNVLAAIGRCGRSLHWISLAECRLVSDLTGLSTCPYFQVAKLQDCAAVTGDTLLALAATPGRRITIRINAAAQGATISAEALLALQESARVRVEWM